MGKNRDVSAFGPDTSALPGRGAVTSGRIPNYGKNAPQPNSGTAGDQVSFSGTGIKGLSDKGAAKTKRRPVRAFGQLPRANVAPLQQDFPRASSDKLSKQAYNTGEVDRDGAADQNSTGRVMQAVQPFIVDPFQGRSGQPDNQSINRGKGST